MKKTDPVVSVKELQKLIRQWEREHAKLKTVDGSASVFCQRTLKGCIDELELLIRYHERVGSDKKRRVSHAR